MLGMKSLALRNPDLAWEALCRLDKARRNRLALSLMAFNPPRDIHNRVRSFVFSDSIIVFTMSDTDDDLMAIVILVGELIARPLHYCIPMRGGIAHDRFLFNLEHSLGVGPALVRAHSLSEGAQWLGICVDQEVCDHAIRIPIQSGGHPAIIPWLVPYKDGRTTESLVLDWVVSHRNNWTVKLPLGVKQFHQPFERFFGPFEDLPDDVRRKYDNTVRFVNNRLLEQCPPDTQTAGE